MARPLLCALVAAALLLGASSASAAALTVRGSVRQVEVTGAAPGARLALVEGSRVVARRRAGQLGGAVFRGVAPGTGYRVRLASGRRSRQVRVLAGVAAPRSTARYGQRIPTAGYGYLTTRDGTRLAIDVRLPVGGGPGPFPTLVEYAGYGYANPAGGESSISQVANLLGFAVVDVNMRGTGCSGGAFDYFEPLQALDGYDVIETVARQPWVLHGRVGMMGISYGGISQLFVGARRPPSLAAMAPLSVIDDTATTLYPGALLDTGFALTWATQRVHDALPASPTGGQRWALDRIAGGDGTCRANQVLHEEAVDLLAKTRANRFYRPAVADPLAPRSFVDRIRAPVFLACQFTDEQTGGHCPTLIDRMTGTRRRWATFTNGTHIDALDPATLTRWYDFLELYVARRAPNLPAAVRALAPTVFKAAMGVDGLTLPADPIQGRGSYAEALAAFEAQPRVRVLFDNGAGGPAPGAPGAGYEAGFTRLPAAGTAARSWFLGADGVLAGSAPARASSTRFAWTPRARPATSFTGDTAAGPGGLWTAAPPYRWQPERPGTAVSWTSAPLAADTTVLGAGAVEAWVRASVPDVDLEATLSEVRPDGQETFVQNGWLRASRRRLDPARSTALAPVPTLREADVAPLPRGRWTKLVIPLYYQGHGYRAGSRIRVAISAPGGDQPVWAFGERVPARGTPTVRISSAPSRPSRLLLPVVPGVAIPTPLPPCPGLRGEPCRPGAVAANPPS